MRPDCPGLCVDCGLRLDDLPEDHTHESIDPRWAGLAGRWNLSPGTPGDDTTMRRTDVAVPKRKMSRSNTRARRSQWKAAAVNPLDVPTACGSLKPPHTACPTCGTYARRQVLDV